MKRLFSLVLTTAFIISTACSTQPSTVDSESNTETVSTTASVTTTIESTIDETEEIEIEETVDPTLKLIAPSEDYVIACLKTVEDITDIEAATEDHDPNQGLNKQGKYIAAIYFRSSKLEIVQDDEFEWYFLENINGNKELIVIEDDGDVDSPVDIGTDGGGQVEVYRTVEEANARNQYLGAFDSEAFASGSHVVVGTMVIRTSNYLTATQQQELTNAVIDALENG